MRLCRTLVTAVLITLSAATLFSQVPKDIQERVFIDHKDQRRLLGSFDLDIVWTDWTYVEIITTPAQIDSLRRAGFKTETIHESVGDFYRSRLPQKDMGGYKTLAEIDAYLDGMIADHPNLVSAKQSIGLTIEGRNIWVVKISDNPNVDENEAEVLYTGCIHAREVVTPEVLFHFMDHLTNRYDTDPEVKDLVDDREIWFILVCNPDGYYYNQVIAPFGGGLWRMNRRDNGNGTFGVDVNRNFGYMWGYDNQGSSPNPGSDTYRGTGPFSEPESQAIRDFMISREFVLSVFWHSYANILIYPWGYIRLPTDDHDIYRALGDSIQNLNGYEHGLVADLLYPVNGGAFDWEYGEQTLKNKVLGTTIEAGGQSDGFWPSLARAEQIKQENLQPLMFLTRMAGNINSLRAPEPPQIVGPASPADGAEYMVSWVETDPTNPAVRFELVEMRKRHLLDDPGDNLDFWETNYFGSTPARSNSAPNSLYSGTGDLYVAHLTTAFPHTVRPGDQLTFRTWYDFEFYRDFAYVEISTDGLNFISIPGNITTNFNPYGGNRGNGISGTSDGWVDATFDLSAFQGQQVWFRFLYQTDEGLAGEGWYIDDIHPHVVFAETAVVASDLTSPSYTFTGRPMDVYYYQVRAMDAQNQWGRYSSPAEVDVLGSGTGDIDLDGLYSTVADLTLLSLYFQQGLSVFDVYYVTQISETDANCDEVLLTAADLNALAEVVVGAQAPCFAPPAPAPGPKTPASGNSSSDPKSSNYAVSNSAVYSVSLQGTTFEGDDTVIVDIVLADAATTLAGYQFHVEYDAATLALDDVRPGDAITAWQFFDYHAKTAGTVGEITLAGVAQFQGAPILPGDIDLQPTPAVLAQLKFSISTAGAPVIAEIRFIWERCGDNAIVCGRFVTDRLVLDSLALSREVRDADGTDITGVDARYGGADYTCFYGLFGDPQAPVVDFLSARITRDGGCCVGQVGDVNGEGGDEPTIGDVTMLVDHLFVTGAELSCLSEADINQSGGSQPALEDITIGDITELVDHLFISAGPLAPCL
ncbi:MAG: M14 family zinc carboxypeptidase [Candidatus Zixiibacteriota bacterium]